MRVYDVLDAALKKSGGGGMFSREDFVICTESPHGIRIVPISESVTTLLDRSVFRVLLRDRESKLPATRQQTYETINDRPYDERTTPGFKEAPSVRAPGGRRCVAWGPC